MIKEVSIQMLFSSIHQLSERKPVNASHTGHCTWRGGWGGGGWKATADKTSLLSLTDSV